jgi:hypothetical protein
MQYHLALAPEFEISAVEFAAAWNADPESRQLAEAAITQAASPWSMDRDVISCSATWQNYFMFLMRTSMPGSSLSSSTSLAGSVSP